MSTAPNAIEPEDYRRLVLPKLLLIAFLGAAVYFNSTLGILTPDEVQTLNASQLRQPGADTWLSSQRLLNATLLLNRTVAPRSLAVYHLVNILIHLLAGLTLFGIVCRTLIRQQGQPRLQEAAPWLALLTALLWLVHPLQTQSVTHLLGRGEALAGLCYLLTLYGFVRAADAEFALPWYGLSVLACALGMGTSPVMVTAPVVVLLFDRIYLAKSFGELARQRAGLYAALAACWALVALPLFAASEPARTVSFSTYLLTQPGVILHDLRLVFWPVGLSVDYSDYPPAQSIGEALPGLAVLALLIAATAWALVRWSRVGFLGAWFLLTLLPSSLVPAPELVNEARMYLPLAAVSAGLVVGEFGLAQVLEKQKTWALPGALVLAVALIGVLGVATFARNYDHAGAVDLWRQTAAVRPHNVRARYYLGGALFLAGKFDDAAAELQTALDAPVDNPVAQPLRTPAVLLLPRALLRTGQSAEALQAVRRFADTDQTAATQFNDLGFECWVNKDPTTAARFFAEAARLQPDEAKYHFHLALALKEDGDKEKSAAALKEGLRRDPQYPATARERAWQRATDIDPGQRNPIQALFLAEEVCQASPSDQPETLDTLAAAYASAGRYREAVQAAKKAHALASARNNSELAAAIQGRILLYERDQPYHQQHSTP